MDDLLIKYMLEEATPEENDQVQQWLAADTANQTHFEKLQVVWQLAAQSHLQPAIDTPQALHRLKQTLKTREAAPRKRDVKNSWSRVWTAAAAVVGIAGLVLGAYVWMTSKTTVKEQLPVIHPDTVLQKSNQSDTVPTVQPVPALHRDTIPLAKPHKKKMSNSLTPVQSVPPKKRAVQQPTQPIDTTSRKRKHAQPAQPVTPIRKHKSLGAPAAHEPVKEPPVS